MNSKHLQKLAALLMVVSVSGCLEQVESNTNTNLNNGVADPSNSAPSITGSPSTAVTVGGTYSFTPSANDPDGDSLSFSISGQPSWASFDNVTGRISGTPDMSGVGTHRNIVVSVSDGELSSSLPAFSITVSATNSTPTISGNPRAQINANSAYNFTPTANDADGDDLTFTVSGLPGWASFSNSDGSITGTPSDANIGTDNNIRITVSDTSNASATLGPFSITVVANNVNSAPTISGNPPAQVNANDPYSFTPTANDADGDNLTFTVSGLPGWASFNTSNGSITGTPSDANVDTYNNISITVSDTSNASATLGPFSITVNAVSLGSVTLSWTPPTKNDDGSDLIDLDGYKIYWGTTPGRYPNSVTLENEGLTSYVVENLVPGTYEFVATSFNTARVESVYSSPATKTVSAQ
ncbi:MAG: putative Ig domain-containing protein [Gammaproteobacteria bacterium]|nr:putative Ig domain-containing protein [Gammaproteobacteria bacterium]